VGTRAGHRGPDPGACHRAGEEEEEAEEATGDPPTTTADPQGRWDAVPRRRCRWAVRPRRWDPAGTVARDVAGPAEVPAGV
jgi:hypothetical protein